MKYLFLILFLCLIPKLNDAQVECVESFYQHFKNKTSINDISIHGDIIKLAVSGEDDKGNILNKITQLRVLIMEEGNLVTKPDYKKLVKGLRSEHFEELMTIKDEGESVNIYLRENEEYITDVLILVNGKDDFVLLSLEGLFKFSDLNDLNLDFQGGEHLKNLPEKKKDVPRA